MTVSIDMRGKLEPVYVDRDLQTALREFNLSIREGNSFLVMEKPDGGGVGIHLPSVLTFEEIDDVPYLA